jgi:mannose-1-phosphate guanylyltransferase
MKALILAAGQGTRLKQLTVNRPKPMLPIRGKPLLQHTIEWLHRYGIRQIAVNLHHHPEAILDCFGDGARFGVALEYSYEASLLGTAGAAKRLQHFLDETFVVIYGDVFTNLDLARLTFAHAQHLEAAGHGLAHVPDCLTMVIYPVSNPEECGLVEADAGGRVVQFVEKPSRERVFTNQAFSGIIVCQPRVLEYVPADTPFDFGHDLFPKLLAQGAPLFTQALNPGEFVIDIGTLGGYLRALSTYAYQDQVHRFDNPQRPTRAIRPQPWAATEAPLQPYAGNAAHPSSKGSTR